MQVLLIDDDARLFELLRTFLADHGVTLHHAPDGPRGIAIASSRSFDAIVLDVMMPHMDGLEVCRRLRAHSNVPIVMLTARGDESDRVVGLELGADDYVPKPFSARELLARIRAVLRRSRPDVQAESLQIGKLHIDVAGRVVTMAGADLELTGLEFDLLVALVRRAGRVVPRDAMLGEAGRADVQVSERTVDVHISHLRAKLGDDSKNPRMIKTVRGVGYVLAKNLGQA
ncbi:MAG: response regulator transcription factor [Myxococcales bacterium]|nr:response regulator transcription factor [Myxococcales bacterium]